MVEKKICVTELRISYNGPVDIRDFFKKVEDWIAAKGRHKEIKKKSEHVTAKDKKVEWFIEIWDMPADYAKTIVRLQALFRDIRKAGKHDVADVAIALDGILETDLESRWFQKPTFYFLRAVYDKYVSKFYTHRFEGKLTSDTYDLYNYLMDYFHKKS